MPVQWYENTQESLNAAIQQHFGPSACLALSSADRVIYTVRPPMGPDGPMGEDRYFLAQYTADAQGAYAFDAPQEVSEAPQRFQTADGTLLDDSISLVYSTPGASGSMGNGKAPPAFVQKMPTKQRHEWVDRWNGEWTSCKRKGGSDADCEVRAFKSANAIVKADDSDNTFENNSYDQGGILGVGPNSGKRYLLVGESGPETLNLFDNAWLDQVDASNNVAYRLADAGKPLPVWQLVHVIGKWVVPHGVSGPIQFDRAMGESFIRNFKAGVTGGRIVLDERHQTEQDGVALAELQELRWGKEGEGLPEAPEPSGTGPILYGRWDYNQLGTQRLSDRNFYYFSPQYCLDFVAKKTGDHYGPTLLAVAATNNPFIRNQRTAQGDPAIPFVRPDQIAASDITILTDGLKPYVAPPQEAPMPPEQTQTQETGQQETAEQRLARLEQEQSELRAQLEAERTARESSDAQLADERRTRYLADVDVYVDGLTRQGVPPGATAKFRTLLKRMNPSAQAVITLSDEQGAPQLTLADAIRECMSEMPAIALHARTFQTDKRPAEQVSLDEQVDAMDSQVFKTEAGAMWAHRAPRNGAAAH